jgi:hypothetical protein
MSVINAMVTHKEQMIGVHFENMLHGSEHMTAWVMAEHVRTMCEMLIIIIHDSYEVSI